MRSAAVLIKLSRGLPSLSSLLSSSSSWLDASIGASSCGGTACISSAAVGPSSLGADGNSVGGGGGSSSSRIAASAFGQQPDSSSSARPRAVASSVLNPVDLDSLLQRHGHLAAEVQAAEEEQQQLQQGTSPADSSRGTQRATSSPAAAEPSFFGADPDYLVDLDPELQRRLQAVGVPTSADAAPAAAWSSRAAAASPAAAVEQISVEDAAEGAVTFEPLRWHSGGRGTATGGADADADAAAAAWLQPQQTWRRRAAMAGEADPWAPLPPDRSIKARLPAEVARLVHESQGKQGQDPQSYSSFFTTNHSSSGGGGIACGSTPDASIIATDPALVFDVLRRQPLSRLQQLLEDTGLPVYGAKDVVLDRITGALTEARRERRQRGNGGDGGGAEAGAERAADGARMSDGADGLASSSSAAAAAAAGFDAASASPPPPSAATTQDQQPEEQEPLNPHRAWVIAAAAARAALLDSVVHVKEVCGWLAAARAQDLMLIDVR